MVTLKAENLKEIVRTTCRNRHWQQVDRYGRYLSDSQVTEIEDKILAKVHSMHFLPPVKWFVDELTILLKNYELSLTNVSKSTSTTS